jgi:N-methylhydantoinase A
VFRVNGGLSELETRFYRRDKLPVEQRVDGPAIILQQDSTTVVPPNAAVVADRFGNLIITVEAAA